LIDFILEIEFNIAPELVAEQKNLITKEERENNPSLLLATQQVLASASAYQPSYYSG